MPGQQYTFSFCLLLLLFLLLLFLLLFIFKHVDWLYSNLIAGISFFSSDKFIFHEYCKIIE